jgi:hypothetical protein
VQKITPEEIDYRFRKKEGGVTLSAVFNELEKFVEIATDSDQLKKKYKAFVAKARKHFNS